MIICNSIYCSLETCTTDAHSESEERAQWSGTWSGKGIFIQHETLRVVVVLYDAEAQPVTGKDSFRYKLYCRRQSCDQLLPLTKNSLTQHVSCQTVVWATPPNLSLDTSSPTGSARHYSKDGVLTARLEYPPAPPSTALEFTLCGLLYNKGSIYGKEKENIVQKT